MEVVNEICDRLPQKEAQKGAAAPYLQFDTKTIKCSAECVDSCEINSSGLYKSLKFPCASRRFFMPRYTGAMLRFMGRFHENTEVNTSLAFCSVRFIAVDARDLQVYGNSFFESAEVMRKSLKWVLPSQTKPETVVMGCKKASNTSLFDRSELIIQD